MKIRTRDLVPTLEMEIRLFWRLAETSLKAGRENCFHLFSGRAQGLHQALFMIDPEAANTLRSTKSATAATS